MKTEPKRDGVVDTLRQAAAILGLPGEALRRAKKNGCPAFRSGSRVHVGELRQWLEKNPPETLPTTDERAATLLKLARLEGQRIKNERLKAELMPIEAVCERISAIRGEIESTLGKWLIDQLPAQNAGLDASAQRENNRKAFNLICARFQAWAKEYDDKLKREI